MRSNTNDDIVKIIRSCIENVIRYNDISVIKSVQEKDVNRKNIYNEISLQHELGIALREELNKRYKNYLVQFERNITSFDEWSDLSKQYKKDEIKDILKKSEIDIVIVNMNNSKEKYAIELKYHKEDDGRIPNTMYDCVKDMYFTNALVNELDFCYSVCLTISEDELFYSNDKKVTGRRKLQNYMYFEKDISEDDVKNRIDLKMKEFKIDSLDETKNPMNIVYLSNNPVTLSIKDFYRRGIVPVKWNWIDEDDIEKGAYYIVEFLNR